MFDKNLEDFIKEIGIDTVSDVINHCPENCDTYLKSNWGYMKRSNKAYYSSDEISIEDLFYINCVYNGISCGDRFKDKLNEKRAKELLNKIYGDGTYV